MIDSLKPASADPVPCKICGDPAPLYGVVDFNRNCEIPNGVKLALSGTPIYYRRCGSCGVDPGYIAERPNSNADVVARLWGLRKSETRVLDYGGGNDVFCTALRANGFPVAVTYDPMVPEYSRRPDGRFDLVHVSRRSNTCLTPKPVSRRSLNLSRIPDLFCSRLYCCQRTSTHSVSTGGTLDRATVTSQSSADRRLPEFGVGTATSSYRSTTISILHIAPCRPSSPICKNE
jgi:methyltransferase family protein